VSQYFTSRRKINGTVRTNLKVYNRKGHNSRMSKALSASLRKQNISIMQSSSEASRTYIYIINVVNMEGDKYILVL